MIEFEARGTREVQVIRDGVLIGKIIKLHATGHWDTRLDNYHFNDARLPIVKQQIHDFLPDHNDQQLRMTPGGQTFLAMFASQQARAS